MVWRLRLLDLAETLVTPEAREPEPGAPPLAVVIVAYETPGIFAPASARWREKACSGSPR